jgi:ACS family glucarate transporter-like MFS transporter
MHRHGISARAALMRRIRWRIFGFLFLFGFIAYIQQKGLTVAAARMMPELSLSQVQIGWLEWAFVLGYAAFQFPGGLLGQRLGAHRMFVLIGTVAFLATTFTPLAPHILTGSALVMLLFALQLLLGLAQGAIYPVGSGVMEAWFHPRSWAIIQGLQSTGTQLAAAATPPLVAYLMTRFGWQQALLWPALPAAAVVALWAWYGRNTPQEHRAVSPEEIAELGHDSSQEISVVTSARGIKRLLLDRSIVFLTLSYVCLNYIFYLLSNWCFLYLVQERHFNVLESGWLAAFPPLAAGVGAGVGGKLVTLMCARFGTRWGFRIIPMLALPCAGLLLLAAVSLASSYAAVVVLSLAYAAVELNEGAYWGAAMYVARSDSMAATGLLNTGGNVGGLIGIPVVAYLSSHNHWTAAFAMGAVCAAVGAATWMGVDAGKTIAERMQAV